MASLELPSGTGEKRVDSLSRFAGMLEKISEGVGFKMSSRGWCYALEPYGLSKGHFDRAENAINECREKGFLAIDFTAEEEGRKFSGVEEPDRNDAGDHIGGWLHAAAYCENMYTPDWWRGEEYYIQMLVEKIDLKTLFEPVCREFHIPIATSKGWSSMLQRAEYARRFKEAEEKGLCCVLLYCGDHDPDGLRISQSLYNNLEQLKEIHWEDGEEGYDPGNLIIDRFGLNYDFILENHLTWIDGLVTGSGKNLASPTHKNFHMAYVQNYLQKVGARKCEANAIVVQPKMGQVLCQMAIERYLGEDARDRFKRRLERVKEYIRDTRKDVKITADNLEGALQEAIKNLPHEPMPDDGEDPDVD